MLKRRFLVELCAACGALLIVATLASMVYAGPICRDGYDLPSGVKKGSTQGKLIYRCSLNEDPDSGACINNSEAKFCDVSEPKCKCRDVAVIGDITTLKCKCIRDSF